MRKFFAVFIPGILVFFLVLAGLTWAYIYSRPLGSEKSTKSFLITKGSSASQVGNKLAKENLIKSALLFKFYVQLTGRSGSIQAGEYNLSPSFSLTRIVTELLKGPSEVWVTIPEGLRREEIAKKFIDELKVQEKSVFYDNFLSLTKNDEGFLFPDTYLFPPTDVTPDLVVRKMKSVFDRQVDTKMKDDIARSGKTLNQVMTMASIIERETLGEAERPVVAGILWKRLSAGWPLQADATLQYAVGSQRCANSGLNCRWWEPVQKADLEINSQYNTYKFAGLPPSPIANPGETSIRAAVYPEESPYWFYLHDPKGVIHYGRTIEEHSENVNVYLQK